MSRGPGELQRAVVAFVTAATEPLTVESMRWDLYAHMGKPAILPAKELPPEWNTSFSRAVKNLAADSRKLVDIERRQLASLEECVRHYPGKSLRVDVRRQRQALLPALLDWTQGKNKVGPHYSRGENEDYFIERLSESRRRWLLGEWDKLESLIRPHFSESGSEDLLRLIVKGRTLFRKFGIRSPSSFSDLVAACCLELPDALADRLRSFEKTFLPETCAGALKLKSYVHQFANVPRHGQCSLKQDTLEALHHLRREFVENMPGFAARNHYGYYYKITYPPALHKLFDQTVFQSFQFIRLAT